MASPATGAVDRCIVCFEFQRLAVQTHQRRCPDRSVAVIMPSNNSMPLVSVRSLRLLRFRRGTTVPRMPICPRISVFASADTAVADKGCRRSAPVYPVAVWNCVAAASDAGVATDSPTAAVTERILPGSWFRESIELQTNSGLTHLS